MKDKLKIGIVRGMGLNKRDMGIYEFMNKNNKENIEFIGIHSYPERFNVKTINLKRIRLLGLHALLIFKYLRIAFSYVFGIFEYMLGFRRKTEEIDIFESIDMAHIYTLQALQTGKPTIIFCYENIPFNYEWFPYNIIKRLVHKKAKYFMVCDERIKNTIKIENPHIEDKNILISPPTIDIDRFKIRGKDEKLMIKYGIKKDKINILFTGRMIYEKGLFDILHAIKLLSLKRNDFNLIIAGNSIGSGFKKVQKRIKKLEIEECINFIGYIDNSEIHILYNCVDIFVLGSRPTKVREEQFGFVFLEAMASGLPIVGTYSGSLPYVINKEGRILSSPGDFYQMSNALETLIEDSKMRKNMGEKNREYIEKKFDPKQIMEERIAFYKKVISENT
ncbi:MAG: glycosyltransferase family 4 protein [candidate division SR1 bacterium]|nr:glycosyltransferase family 4 protein [candidate division SR1 bacterium]